MLTLITKNYYTSGITIEFDASGIDEELTLRKSNLSIPDSLKKKFTDISEYFELSMQNENSELINVDSKIINLQIKLDTTKKFLGIYKVNGNRVEKLSYKYVSEDEIKLNTNNLGKFIVSYEEKEIKKDDEKDNSSQEEFKEKNDFALIGVLLISILVSGTAGVILYKKRNS